jgi:ribosomal protein S18 acetylase RimI-like enzyme
MIPESPEANRAGPPMIRRARVGDAGAIAGIHVRTWRDAYAGMVPADFLESLSEERREAFWREQLLSGNAVTLVAEAGGEVAGWVTGGPSREADLPAALEVYAIYVSRRHWRRGLGRRLIGELEAALPCSGEVVLWVLVDNEPAIRFYRSLGFEPDGRAKTVSIGGADLAETRFFRPAAPRRTQGTLSGSGARA